LNSGQTTLVEHSPAAPVVPRVVSRLRPTLQQLRLLSSASTVILRDQRRYAEVGEVEGPISQSGSIVYDICSDSESEFDDLHFGDGLPPRNPTRSSTARIRDGQSRAWMVTPGRPPTSGTARACFSYRGIAPQYSHYVQTEPFGDDKVSMRGGADSEDQLGVHNDSSHTLLDPNERPRSLHESSASSRVLSDRTEGRKSGDSRFIELMNEEGSHLYAESLRRSGSRELRETEEVPSPSPSLAPTAPSTQPNRTAQPVPSVHQITHLPPSSSQRPANLAVPHVPARARDPPAKRWYVGCDSEGCCYLCDEETVCSCSEALVTTCLEFCPMQ